MSKTRKRPVTAVPNQRKRILALLKENSTASPEEVTAKLFPSISRNTREFKARVHQVKRTFPADLRRIEWRIRHFWESEELLDPGLFMQLSVAEKNGRKKIGSKNDPCQCTITSQGKMEVQVHRRSWRGWLIQQLIDFGWPAETAHKFALNLRCRSKSSELKIRPLQVLRVLKELNIHDSENNIRLKIGANKVIVTVSPRLAELLQNSRDREDEALSKLRIPESSQVVLASVSTFHTERLFQGLGLNPQQIKQASDTLVTVGVEDQAPDFVYLVYGPVSRKSRQVGVRALITPLANYEIRLTQ